MKSKRKIGAKLNLTLDIIEQKGNFHQLKSLVVELSICDFICVKSRNDDKITLKIKGANLPLDERNNAYKTAKLFKERFNTKGVDIFIKKKIPLGGGLGGSSADSAGVLLAMKKIFKIEDDLRELSSLLGSDVYYMLSGKSALMQGKGEEITKIETNKKLYFLLCPCEKECLAKNSYAEYDRQGLLYPFCTDKAKDYYIKGDYNSLLRVMKNDLLPASIKLVPEIKENMKILFRCGNAYMTGSGATTFSVFESKKERNFWYRRLKKHLPLIKAQSVIK